VIEVTQIFVRVVDEAVDVWVPVQAQHRFGNVYRIIDQPYDRETETWEFGPGEDVVCTWIDASEGQILAATSPHKA
jgi:hypothetical protein